MALLVPALAVLGVVVAGAWLLFRPPRVATPLADGSGLQRRFSSQAFRKLLLRVVGAGLIGLGAFLGVAVMHLGQTIAHWQPAPQSPSLSPCGAHRPHDMPCIPAH